MTKKLDSSEKVNRRPISRACKFCHEKHLQCDPGRPCKNCVKRGLQDSCESIRRKRAKYLVDTQPVENNDKLLNQIQPAVGAVHVPTLTHPSVASATGFVFNQNVATSPNLANASPSSSTTTSSSSTTTTTTTAAAATTTTKKPTARKPSSTKNKAESVTPTSSNTATVASPPLSITPSRNQSLPTSNKLQQQANRQQFIVNDQMFPSQQHTNPQHIFGTGGNDNASDIKNKSDTMSDISSMHSLSNLSTPQTQPTPMTQQQQQYLQQQQQQQHIQSLLPHFQRKNNNNNNNNNQILPAEIHQSQPDIDINKFASKYANQEYLQLSEILDNNFIPPSSPSSSIFNYNNPEFRTAFQSDNNIRASIIIPDNSILNQQDIDMVDQYSHDIPMTVQDCDYTSPLIQRHLIKTPNDVYVAQITSYNYPKAYLALLDYLKYRFKKDQLYAIAETMAAYRPRFIAATRSLVEMDLLFAERSFQRSLLEYESMSTLSSSPTIMWRRTGEIVAVSPEFASMTSYTKSALLAKRTFIVELMNDHSALDYFKKFSSLAFSEINAIVISDCTLISPNGDEIPCSTTWTVKRDVFDIPMLIVGQFLPILHVS